jgi:hypothetical protein
VAVLFNLRSTACAINAWNLDAHLNLDGLSVLSASHVLQGIMYIAVLFGTFKAYGWFLLLPDFILLLIITIIRFIRLSCGLHGRFSRAKIACANGDCLVDPSALAQRARFKNPPAALCLSFLLHDCFLTTYTTLFPAPFSLHNLPSHPQQKHN